ncbi:PAS domain S-box protein [Desulfopila sp. IMCC35006]|uniref:two-component system sensor histidine kinase NtrB n=1 Tax=Desulfopila sp. IMCC35006 TaxID=2569542 RepID=UPI0010ABA907|nr:ATP-binding protein [Desulfopila sp. IMCC35006]TKB27962.1 PAS domain S-box protein [Desulfopila sp. IMCC35006]
MDFSTLLDRARNTISTNQLLRNQLLWMLLLRIILYTSLMALSYMFTGTQIEIIVLPANLFILLLLVVYLTTIVSAFWLLIYQGSLRKFGFIQTLIDTGFAALLVFFSGSSSSIFSSVFFFPIVAGGLILPRKGGLIAAAAATLLFGAILFLERYGLYPAYLVEYLQHSTSSPLVILNSFSVHGLTFFLAAILSALFGKRLLKTEHALSDSLKNFDRLAILYKQIFDNISTGIVTIDGQGIITSANAAVEKIIGSSNSPLTLIGQNLADIFPRIELTRENQRLTTDFQKDDGCTVRIGYAHMVIQGTEKEQLAAEPPHKIITLRDISDIEKLEQQVRQTEKLAAIGMMSASIAHDFRNPLTAISGSAQVLAKEFSAEGAKSYANFQLTNIIQRESNRLITTIADFLRFSRPEHCHCNWFSLRSCLDEVMQVLRADPAWPNSAKIILDFKGTVDIWADEKQMFTVFNHLIQNGLAFCPEGKQRIVVTANEVRTTDDQEAIEISIKDNGPGLDESKKGQIFEPFFTTRADGTGLGLAIVKQTIEEHHGTLTVQNGAAGGAIFTLQLPLPQ